MITIEGRTCHKLASHFSYFTIIYKTIVLDKIHTSKLPEDGPDLKKSTACKRDISKMRDPGSFTTRVCFYHSAQPYVPNSYQKV